MWNIQEWCNRKSPNPVPRRTIARVNTAEFAHPNPAVRNFTNAENG